MWTEDPNSCSPRMTPSGQRICDRFEGLCCGDSTADLGFLLLALLEEESLGGSCLQKLGLTCEVLADGAFGPEVAQAAKESPEPDATRCVQKNASTPAAWYVPLMDKAAVIARRSQDSSSISSEHLVQAMVELDSPVFATLKDRGITVESVRTTLGIDQGSPDMIPVDVSLNMDDAEPEIRPEPDADAATPEHSVRIAAAPSSDANRLLALIDANLNRTREGLRVLEDYARFITCDEGTTRFLKTMRHRLVEAELELRVTHPLLQSRDVAADAGTAITTKNEEHRGDMGDLVIANCRRVQEALRSLEEFGKLVSTDFAAHCKQLRYRSYDAEQQLVTSITVADGSQDRRSLRLRRLHSAQIYVLLTEEFCRLPWQKAAEATLKGGADILQLREKQLSPSERIRRASWLRNLCAEHQSLLIINDDPHIAAECQADGLHVGQDDATVEACRSVLAQDQLLGLSTHHIDQLKQAENQAVDYVGVGPMFSTETKSFDAYAGPKFAAEASAESRLPWFAIGGIGTDNLKKLVDCGTRRIAVCGSVIGSDAPDEAVRNLRSQLPVMADAREMKGFLS